MAYLSRCGQGLGQAGGVGKLPRLTVTGSYCHLQGQRERGVARTWGQLLQEEEPHAGVATGMGKGEWGTSSLSLHPLPIWGTKHREKGGEWAWRGRSTLPTLMHFSTRP